MITAIIMAAGFSRRMGRKKLIMKIKEKYLIEWTIDLVDSIDFLEKIIVYQDKKVKELAEQRGLKVVHNPEAIQGMSTSMKLGIENALESRGFMFFTGDQPFLNKNIVNKMIDFYYASDKSIIVPRYNGKNGNPVIFDYKWRKELINVQGDRGGRDLIKSNFNEVHFVDFEDQKAGVDIDTMEDYKRIINKYKL